MCLLWVCVIVVGSLWMMLLKFWVVMFIVWCIFVILNLFLIRCSFDMKCVSVLFILSISLFLMEWKLFRCVVVMLRLVVIFVRDGCGLI